MKLTRTSLRVLGMSLCLAAFSAGLAQAAPTSRAGKIYRQEIASPTGDTVVIQVFEPKLLQRGKRYPLVLHSHGYGGSRMIEPSRFAQKLIDSGYYVISIDERGNGESSGTIRVMSPDFEGQNLVAVLDWAENLEGLRRDAAGKMVVGSYGGSYGGMYQLLLMGADPQQRLHVIAPDITPHDLNYSLDSGDVVKSGYGLALVAGGELPLLSVVTGGNPALIPAAVMDLVARGNLRQDQTIYEILLQAVLRNSFTPTGRNFFGYHSVRYFCDGQQAGPQSFLIATPDPLRVTPAPFPKVDALLTQGFRDTLFNFNDGYDNYQCLKARGGDVRLLTHQSGHILPASLTAVTLPPDSNLEEALDPFYAALTAPNFQDAGGSRSCGSLVLDDVQFAWFEEKLQRKRGVVNAALSTGRNVCLSLARNDAIAVRDVKVGGTRFPIRSGTPQLNSALGVVGAALGNGAREALLATQPLYTVPAGGSVIAGLPTMNINLSALVTVGIAQQVTCAIPLNIGGCDPILFLGVGHRKAGKTRWDLIDDQLTPVRGFGQHAGRMSGIAERLAPGDQLALLIYGFHAQYPVTWSRDLAVPALNLSGSVQLPLLNAGEIVRDGV